SMVTLMRDNGLTDVWQIARVQEGGGYLGGLFVYALVAAIGNLGAIFTFVVFGVIGGILASGITREDMGLFLKGLAEMRQTAASPTEREIPLNPARNGGQAIQRTLPLDQPATPPEPESPPTETAVSTPAKPEPKNGRTRRKPSQPKPEPPTEPETAPTPIFLGRHAANVSWKLPVLADMLEAGADQKLNSASIREQVEVIEHTLESFGAPATVVEINQGPTITQFGVEPNFIEMRSGKRTKVKVGKIASLADDLALALAAHSIRIQAPVPGKGYVGIEVPNVSKVLVSLRDVLEAPEFQKIIKKSPLAIGLGQNVSGQPIAADLAAMPHLLIAGTTGSGKSVCVNSIIAGLLLLNTPDVLKVVMVDPKRVELTGYNGIPHLAAPVVVEMDRVIGTLQWALREMDHRYKLFSEIGARNITDYNKKTARTKDKEKLPYIVIIIDELADLMMLAPEDTERSITRLAQMARATGIHMVIATQRPSVDVVTGLIKANFPARIAFAVASSTDSRVILDSTGAERLLGQGDMLFQSPDAASPVRLQGTYVSPEELDKLIEYWRTARRFNLIPAHESITPREADEPERPTPLPPVVRESLAREAEAKAQTDSPVEEEPTRPLEITTTAEPVPPPQVNVTRKEKPEERQRPLWEELQALEEETVSTNENEDDLMLEAITLVRKLNKASTSLLQRRFRIGYTRAARIMDAMEEQGIIGPPTGTSKAREVLPWDGLGTDTAVDEENESDM
ncbi:MAG: DNA translocase FtsK, partial [Anaerolineales bacterium]|nr:DNA translocase FtsK [Anaerolineales bacterium]